MSFTNPIFCAIDRPDPAGALALARSLTGAVGGVKLGLELFTPAGPEAVRPIVASGLPVFLDLKLHDIPNTVAGATRAAAGLGAAMLTLHVSGGPAMLRAAVQAVRDLPQRPALLGVTVLTSLDAADLETLGINDSPRVQSVRLARLALACGLDGVICSPHEIRAIRAACGPDLKLVVPGIRPAGSVSDDQKRIMTPADALAQGADLLVIGRPITDAADPRAAALAIVDSLSPASSSPGRASSANSLSDRTPKAL